MNFFACNPKILPGKGTRLGGCDEQGFKGKWGWESWWVGEKLRSWWGNEASIVNGYSENGEVSAIS